jgi:dTDP-4-dehydrorhamnose reductase
VPNREPRGILITGTTGQVGGALLEALQPLVPIAGEIHAPNRDRLNLADPDSIRAAVRSLRPRWILNPAAYTAVDQAESEPALARAINTDAPRILGEEAHQLGAAVLHFSTDYVFDGQSPTPYRENDLTAPINVYGATKRDGELALAATGAAHIILRTSWVYGATGKNFLLTVLRVAAQRPEMKIVADQHGAPTWSHDLASLAAHILAHCEHQSSSQPLAHAVTPIQGIYHATSAGETTWFGFAQEALRQHQTAAPQTRYAQLLPIPTAEYPTPAPRPRNSRLDGTKLFDTFAYRLPPWQDSLSRVLTQLPA